MYDIQKTSIVYTSFDMTETERTNELYEDSKPIIATIFLDNYDEITQNMNDTQRSEINSMVTREVVGRKITIFTSNVTTQINL